MTTTTLKDPGYITRQVNKIHEIYPSSVTKIAENAAQCISTDELKAVKNIVTAGDGDSFFASLAAELAFNQFTDVFYAPLPAMKFLAYGIDTIPQFSSSKTLAVGISASGGSTRVIQAINHAKDFSKEIDTLGLVGKAQSKLAGVTKFVLSAELPDHGTSPGIRTYVGSLLGLFLLAIRTGECQGTITPVQADELREKISNLGSAVSRVIEESRKKAVAASAICKDFPMLSFVGSGPSYGTAMYAGAKVVEAVGKFVAVQDLEEWGHIERFSYPLDYPVIMIAPPGKSYWRAVQLAEATSLLGHSVIAVVSEDEEQISKIAKVTFRIPSGIDEVFSPLLYFIPATLLAYQLAVDLNRCLLQTDNEYVNSIRDALNKQTKV
jgi:glucosamine--fructose-6-phosphate aminotransferase (isomerizing)